jgi:hypothetical protein
MGLIPPSSETRNIGIGTSTPCTLRLSPYSRALPAPNTTPSRTVAHKREKVG